MVITGLKRKDRPPETAYNVRGESSSTSNTFNSTPKWEYDVFLSFAGKDTRLTFTDHLYAAFSRSGIRCFRDDVDLPRGENINFLFRAIEDSLCSVLVISKNYANSKWCLDELQKILESRNILDRWVFPIFYDVDPADVRNQRGSFGEALAELVERFRENTTKVQNWRTALSEIGNLSGWVTRGRHEADLIKNVVGGVWSFLSSKLPSSDDNLVGIDSKVAELMPLLDIGLDDKSFFGGIWGMGGVGKTTLARVVSEKLAYKFDICCFLENVKDALPQGLVSLQKSLLSDLKIKDMEIHDGYKGMQMIKKFLRNKKVLLVLDDIDDMSQLKNLAESPDWFGKGSRIIITTRDSQLLTSSGVDEQRIYELKTMMNDESLKLFSNKAFNKDHPPEGDYLEYSKSVVEYAGSLPLALEVLGHFFCKKSKAEWISALDRLKQDRKEQILSNDRIRKMLQISYDGLKHKKEKTIFLDIACFFKGWKRKEVTRILESCDLHPTIGIKVLIEKALLVETKDGRLDMHDLIEDLGRYIVHQECPNNVGKRSRLWKFEDIKAVLENNTGSEAIQAIVLPNRYFSIPSNIEVHPEALSKMSNIRLLLLHVTTSYGTSKSNIIRWPSAPLDEHTGMYFSDIKQLWNGKTLMDKLKFIKMIGPHNLAKTPDFSGVPFLEHLYISEWPSLVEVHSSLGKLEKLAQVILESCENLEILPTKLETNSLIMLYLGGSKKVAMLPEFGEGMTKLSHLYVQGTGITTLPESLGCLTGLRYLDLDGCRVSNLGKLQKTCITGEFSGLNVAWLTELDVSNCGLNDGLIPDDLGSLSSLIAFNLSFNEFVNLPIGCFSRLSRLVFLSLEDCCDLKSLPRLPPQLIRLQASGCDSMEPLSDRQSWNLVASLNHENRGRAKYVISYEENDYFDEYDGPFLVSKHDEPKCLLPLRDFCAIISGREIPSWFSNKEDCYLNDYNREYVIKVNIPPSLRDSEWSGLVVCFYCDPIFSVFSWRTKAAEDDDCICKEWAHCTVSSEYMGWECYLCIMVLELNEETCWQHLRGHNNTLHVKFEGSFTTYVQECGWRVICKEEIQKWCNDNDFNQLTQSQLASPHDEINLPSTVFNKFIRNVGYDRYINCEIGQIRHTGK